MIISPPIEIAPTLLSAPIELAGKWGHMLPRSADLVVERMWHSCLDGVRLVGDAWASTASWPLLSERPRR